MRKYFSLLLGLTFFSFVVYGQSHGLQFSSHEVVPEKRTSLNLTPGEPLCLSHDSQISFDLNFSPNLETYFGYIIRVITTNNQNIDVVYNQKLLNFNFVIGETFSCVFNIDSARLFGDWNHCNIRFDDKAQEVSFYVNDRFVCKGKLKFSDTTCCRIYFGANDYEGFKTTDIPPMRIKDIRISTGKRQKYFYPLEESTGNQCVDVIEKKTATVSNPVWIKPRHQHWQNLHSFETANTPSIAFDKTREVLYIVSTDSLYEVSIKNGRLTGTRLAKSRDTLPAGNQSVFDPATHKLYNFYIDDKKVSAYNAISNSWDVNFPASALTEFWQANKFIAHADSALYIIGGYGQLQYKNLVQRYSFATNTWEVIKPGGDFFMPRYLAALGTNEAGDSAYIIGGYGSNSGDQTINPKYSHELLAYSVKTNSFKHIYQLKDPDREFCFANSLIIDRATNDFYSLIYPIDRFNSSLQLIKGSLNSPGYALVADSIPYSFHDIESFVDLYYSPASKKLVAVTLFSSKNGRTTLKIFTLDFPPNPLITGVKVESKKQGYLVYIVLGALAIIVTGYIFWKRRKSQRAISTNKQNISSNETKLPPIFTEPLAAGTAPIENEKELSSIFLFGQFEVIDKNGVDIARQFTPLVKELFLLILIYTFKDGKGISSEQLYEILWSDKSLKDARNNYSVNIVKLKAILEKVGDSHISKESGKWKLEVLSNSIKIDYEQFVKLTNSHGAADKKYIDELFSIIHRGSFLREVQYSWLDDTKSDVSSFVIDTVLKYMASTNLQAEAEYIVKLANCIFHFDQLNEEALEYKCKSLVILGRHGMAKDAYVKFAKEYKENYGQDFERSFTDMVGHI